MASPLPAPRKERVKRRFFIYYKDNVKIYTKVYLVNKNKKR